MRSLRPLTVAGGRMAFQQRSVMGVAAQASRFYSTQDPKAKAQSIIDALPGNSVLSKSGILATGFAAATYAVANSLYVVNAETVLLTCFFGFIAVVSKTAAPGYKAWADGHVNHIKNTLNKAREDHVVAVQNRIDNVEKHGDVVSTTKDLFAISKQTVELEAKAFELKQQVDLAKEAKEVLDSWVRWEAQIRAREQSDLYAAVVAKVDKALESDKFQKDNLNQAVAEIERLFKKN